jgi:hypothetical protein
VSCKQVPISTSFKQSIILLKATRIINLTFFSILKYINCITQRNQVYIYNKQRL